MEDTCKTDRGRAHRALGLTMIGGAIFWVGLGLLVVLA